ncbi:hypothetical protein OQA88_7148 [Cercophora sp. LCS_1]
MKLQALFTLLLTPVCLALPAPEEAPFEVVTLDWDAFTNGSLPTNHLQARAPIPGASILVWSKSVAVPDAYNCVGNWDINYLNPQRDTCYQFALSNGAPRQHQSLQFVPGSGSGCRIRVYSNPGCSSYAEGLPGACVGRGGPQQFVGIRIVQGPSGGNCPA